MGVKSCAILLLDILFFFKQKTAYEMRISDWSSDVCSSDLPGSGMPMEMRIVKPARDRHLQAGILQARRVEAKAGREMVTSSPRMVGEIGRASCRERVCQYV